MRKTKGALLYENLSSKRDGDGQLVTTIYLRKSMMQGKEPNEVKLTVEVDDE